MDSDPTSIPVAIIGVGALFPGSDDVFGFWKDILAGTDLITDVPEHRWLINDYFDEDQSVPDKTYGRRGGFLDHTSFDPLAFGIPPNVIEATDTAQLLALIVAQQVLEDAYQGQFKEVDKSRMSVVLGVTAGQELMNEMASRLQRPVWVKALREVGLSESDVQNACDRISNSYTAWQENTFPGLLGNVVAGRIANRFDFGGTNCVTDAACASALSALSLGLNELYLGHSDVVITGGVDTFNDIFMYMCFSKTPALSATGDCRPFSSKADGTILGEGLAMFALKRLEDAENDGDRIYAVIRGCGSSSDGRAKSIYAPSSAGQARALSRAYERAGYSPDTVDLVEAHGTGTRAGDAAEFEGLRSVFQSNDQRTALGSIKSQIGHTKAAAGAAGLLKVVLGLHHRVLPPTLKVDEPNPKLHTEDSAFYLNTESRPWLRPKEHGRRGSVSAFGFGGSNFHVTLEEYEGENRARFFRPETTECFLVSANDENDLKTQIENLSNGFFHDIASKSRESFDPTAPIRFALVSQDRDDLLRKIKIAIDTLDHQSTPSWEHPSGIYFDAKEPGRVAFLFPGQGSQYLKMGADCMATFPMTTAPWDRIADTIFDHTSLCDVVFPKPAFDDETAHENELKITATEWAQPSLGATELVYLELATALGFEPDAYAGHSYGELTALHASGVLDETAFLALSRKRGELMRDASVNDGAMSAVATDIQNVLGLLEDSDVVVANHNGATQVVVSGSTDAIEQFEQRLKSERIGFKRLNVATAFHSSIVSDAVEPFRDSLKNVDVNASKSDRVYSNATAKPYLPVEWVDTLATQIKKPVRWVETIERMIDDGVTTFVEVGPGSVLSKLTSRIVGARGAVFPLDQRGRTPWSNAMFAIARYAVSGGRVQTQFLHAFRHPVEKPEPAMSVEIAGGNYNKPYPPKGGYASLPKPNPEKPNEPVMTDYKKPKPPQAPIPVQQPTQPQPARPHSPSPGATDATVWLAAFQESQRQMAYAHTAYQNAMAQSHTAFLNALAQSQASMASALSGQPVAIQSAPVHAPQPIAAAPVWQPPVAPQAPAWQPPVAPQAPAWQPPVAAQPAVQAPPVVPAAPVAQPSRPVTATEKPQPNLDVASLEDILLETIADKTGYPREMLAVDMQLEADLGIDSIKRVEILSAVTDATGQFSGIEGSEMNSIQTIGGVLDFLRARSNGNGNGNGHGNGNGSHPVLEKPELPITEPVASADLQTELLDVVASKTGYPIEMLNLDMKLEADLGIDSIKRVEILSEVTDRNPALGDLDGTSMANLATLGEIVDFIETSVAKK